MFDEILRQVHTQPPTGITRTTVADGAGVSRQTLYNRWSTVADIVLDALLDRAERTIGVTETSLTSYLTDLAAAAGGWARPGLRAVATFAQSDPVFAGRFRTDFLPTRHGALRRAVGAEVPDANVADRVSELIAASMWYRILVIDAALDQEWINAMTSLTADARGVPSRS
ncbi:MAG: TetR-like C-terminal domain-containing protein [Actinomycetota bacterium]